VLEVDLLGGYSPAAGTVFDLMDFGSFSSSAYTFDFSHAPLAPGLSWDTSRFATTGQISVTVPEPTTLALLAAAGLGLAGWAWRRRKA
jgi:hypothetical protein